MDGVRVGGEEGGGQSAALGPSPSRPAPCASSSRVFEDEVARDDVPPTGESKGQIMPVRPELELEVVLVASEQEELDDLVVPETVAASGRPGRRRIAVVRGLDLDLDRVAETELDASGFARQQGLVVPGPAKLEAESIHV
jgi:hypothetical protein